MVILSELECVKRSQKRVEVMKSLQDGIKMPSEIVREKGMVQNYVSTALKQLRQHGLVECLNPEMIKGRLYHLTGDGERMVRKL